MNWEPYFTQRPAWLEGTGEANDVVLCSRIRLARNLADTPFPARLTREGQEQVLRKVAEASAGVPSLRPHEFVALSSLKKLERQFLMERRLISPEMAFEEGEQAVLIGPQQLVTLMVNEEDHLRLQAFQPGLSLRAGWHIANQIDDELSQQLPFAFDEDWGYCTRCPTNVGTGMRASCLVHLPALVMNGDIQRVLEELARMGVSARGLYGERSKAWGDLFQISNARSLGQSETEIVEMVEQVIQSLVHYERKSREGLGDVKHHQATEDTIYRAWGILRNARVISYDEAMLLLSRVRLGLAMGFDLPVTPAMLNNLMILTQPAHLQLLKGGPLKAEDRDCWRAALIRHKLANPDKGLEPGTSNPKQVGPER
jgi:protein arginine kinase